MNDFNYLYFNPVKVFLFCVKENRLVDATCKNDFFLKYIIFLQKIPLKLARKYKRI